MLEINRYRLCLYELLFNNPLCDYNANDLEEDNNGNVLFIGSGEKALETYKTMFWASQYPNNKLSMTFMGNATDVEFVQKSLGDKTKFPALEEFINIGYADKLYYVVFSGDFRKEEDIRKNVQRLNIGIKSFSYIIVATGNAYIDWEYLVNIEAICDDNKDKVSKVLVGLYNDGLNDKLSTVKWEKVANNLFVLQFERAEEELEKSDLKRIAANINLAYSVKYDERLNVEANYKEFEQLCLEEFNGINGKKYNADSSYASAVHISSKLSYCMEYSGKKKSDIDNWQDVALEILAESIEKENELFEKLYYWEHKRWNAYMVMRGYRHPEPDEWVFVYSKGKKNVDNDQRLHVCMCESGERLNPNMNKQGFWKKLSKELKPLDYASYRCNNIARMKTKELEKSIYSRYDFINGVMFNELREAIEDLFSESGNSIENYKKIMKKTRLRKDIAADKEILEKLDKLNNELSIVIIRNQYINFFEYDAQLVRLIPFTLWYGKKYQEVFVFSNGIAAKDVVIPTLLYAKKAYFVVKDKDNENYKSVIQRYFVERGGNTETKFISYDDMLQLTKDKNVDGYVIAGEGELKEDYLVRTKNVINVRYNAKNNKINNANLFCGLSCQSFSVKEFIHLLGGDIKEEFRDTFSNKIFNELENLFWKYAKIEEGTKFVPWNRLITIFTKESRETNKYNKELRIEIANENVPLDKSEKKIIYLCDMLISQEKYLINIIDKFLIELYDYHLIDKFVTKMEGENIKVRFITFHKEICNIVEEYGAINAECKIAKLDIGNRQISTDELVKRGSSKYKVVIEKGKEKYHPIKKYKDFLEDLKKLRIIKNYSEKEGVLESVTIENARILDLLKKEGDIFEKITFHRFEKSNMFGDIKNGVHFYWNREAQDSDEQKRTLKKKIDDIAKDNIVNLVDADNFCQIHNNVFQNNQSDYEENQVSNEIDVIAIRGMQAYFISCKATYEIKKEYLDEIANHAKNAGAIPILAMSKPLDKNSDAILSRAIELNHIQLLGRDELDDQGKFNVKIKELVKEL